MALEHFDERYALEMDRSKSPSNPSPEMSDPVPDSESVYCPNDDCEFTMPSEGELGHSERHVGDFTREELQRRFVERQRQIMTAALKIRRLERDLAAAHQRIADLELSVSSDGLRLNLVDSLREKRQQLAAAREEIEGLRGVLKECRSTLQYVLEVWLANPVPLKQVRDQIAEIDAALESRRQGEKTS